MDIEPITHSEIDLNIKFDTLSRVTPIVAKYGLIISGSLSEIITSKQKRDEKVTIQPEDLIPINDIDVADTPQGKSAKQHQFESQVFDTISGLTKFDVHYTTIAEQCAYNEQVRNLGIRSATIIINGTEYQVLVTTPEFLLLHNAITDSSLNLNPHKIRDKILRYQQHPAFSPENFLTLADFQIKDGAKLAEKEYEHLQKSFLLDSKDPITGPQSAMEIFFEWAPFWVNEAKLRNSIRIPSDIVKIPFNEVRKQTALELFVSEFKELVHLQGYKPGVK